MPHHRQSLVCEGHLLEFLAATLVAQLHAMVQQFLFLSQARVHVGRIDSAKVRQIDLLTFCSSFLDCRNFESSLLRCYSNPSTRVHSRSEEMDAQMYYSDGRVAWAAVNGLKRKQCAARRCTCCVGTGVRIRCPQLKPVLRKSKCTREEKSWMHMCCSDGWTYMGCSERTEHNTPLEWIRGL